MEDDVRYNIIKQTFNLSMYQGKIINFLITKGNSTVNEISKCGVPRSRVYDVVETLKCRGLILEIKKKEVVESARKYTRTKAYKKLKKIPRMYGVFELEKMIKNTASMIKIEYEDELKTLNKMGAILKKELEVEE